MKWKNIYKQNFTDKFKELYNLQRFYIKNNIIANKIYKCT